MPEANTLHLFNSWMDFMTNCTHHIEMSHSEFSQFHPIPSRVRSGRRAGHGPQIMSECGQKERGFGSWKKNRKACLVSNNPGSITLQHGFFFCPPNLQFPLRALRYFSSDSPPSMLCLNIPFLMRPLKAVTPGPAISLNLPCSSQVLFSFLS